MLPDLLERVKEIKAERYVGTGEAFKVVKKVSNIRNSPVRVSKLINRDIRGYQATPERIIGLNELLVDSRRRMVDRIKIEEQGIFKERYYYFLDDANDSPVLQVSMYYPFSDNTDDLSKQMFFPFFETADRNQVQSNKDFKKSVIECIQDAAEEIRMLKGRQDNSIYDEFIREIEEEDFDFRMSPQELLRVENEQIKMAYREMRLHRIVSRLINERIENSQENRRMVLSVYFESEDERDYDKIISKIDRRIIEKWDKLSRFEKVRAPKPIISWVRENLDADHYVRRVLGQEKSFVLRYLR